MRDPVSSLTPPSAPTHFFEVVLAGSAHHTRVCTVGFGLYGHQDEGGPGTQCTITCADGNDDCSDTCPESYTCHCGRGWWTGMSFCKTTGDTGTCEARPVTDECNGHFGPTPEQGPEGELVYHYHARLTPPYTMGCFGPSWQRCAELHGPDANHCESLCMLYGYVCLPRERFHLAVVCAHFSRANPTTCLCCRLLRDMRDPGGRRLRAEGVQILPPFPFWSQPSSVPLFLTRWVSGLAARTCPHRYEHQFDFESVEFGPGYQMGQEIVPNRGNSSRHTDTHNLV
jgi:hypothetical protein